MQVLTDDQCIPDPFLGPVILRSYGKCFYKTTLFPGLVENSGGCRQCSLSRALKGPHSQKKQSAGMNESMADL